MEFQKKITAQPGGGLGGVVGSESEQRNLSAPDYIERGASGDIVTALNSSRIGQKKSLPNRSCQISAYERGIVARVSPRLVKSEVFFLYCTR